MANACSRERQPDVGIPLPNMIVSIENAREKGFRGWRTPDKSRLAGARTPAMLGCAGAVIERLRA
jgi:hypothetical protein